MTNMLSTTLLVEWLRTKDPDEHYYYCSANECCIAQYLSDAFPDTRVSVSPMVFSLDGHSQPLPAGWNDVAYGDDAEDAEDGTPTRTFGAALKRAENLLDQLEDLGHAA